MMSPPYNIHFLRPEWFYALIPVIFLLWYVRRHQEEGWRAWCDPKLFPYVVDTKLSGSRRLPFWLTFLVSLLTILALAGPAWERLPTPVFRNFSALVVVLDLSQGMEATDLSPNRLERARFKIEDILRLRKEGQTALVVYAGDAFTVTPLTEDVATIASQLSALHPELLPVQGARIDLGLKKAGELLKQAGFQSGRVLLISTGSETSKEAGRAMAAHLRAEGYPISVLGVGTTEGGPIPLNGKGFLKDEQGNILLSRLESQALRDIAEAGGGYYQEIRSEPIDRVLRWITQPTQEIEQSQGENSLRVEQWREEGVWLLPFIVGLTALGFRRGWLGMWLLLTLIPLPQPAHAFDWDSFWLTPEQQAKKAFDEKNYAKAAKLFTDPEWKAAAQYKADQDASKTLKEVDTARAHYNRGNALARENKYQEAITEYERAVTLLSSQQQNNTSLKEDAVYNRQLVMDALQQQQNKNSSKQDGQDESSQTNPSSEQKGKQEKSPSSQEAKQDTKEQQGHNTEKGQNNSVKNGSGESQENTTQPHSTESDTGEDTQASSSEESKNKDGSTPEKQQDDKTPAAQGEKTDDSSKGEAEKQELAKQGTPIAADKTEHENTPHQETEVLTPLNETQQAQEQWLGRIPDNPGGLLRRKFLYQHRERQSTLSH